MQTCKYLIALTFCACLPAAHASRTTVGSCQPHQHAYPTISSAIAAARPGDEIDICPGTYPEQLTITKPLSIQGIVVPNQAGVTITAPTAGLQQLPAGSAFYPQVYINRAGGPVTFSNLAIDGTVANILYGTIAFDTTSACQLGFMKDFSGIYFQNTPGFVQGVSISGHFVSSFFPGDPQPQQYPDCGSGIEFNNGYEPAIVTNSVINGFGFTGISSTGSLVATHNVLTTPSGPYQIGIQSTKSGQITNNTVSGAAFFKSTGIQGGAFVQANFVEGFSLGIVNAGLVYQNTLLNNSVAISDPGAATGNIISNSNKQYIDPSCAGGACGPNPTYDPTIGVDAVCEASNQVRENSFVGVGVGVANIKKNATVSSTNLFAGVGVTSTNCAQ